jgi:hypothetical protein
MTGPSPRRSARLAAILLLSTLCACATAGKPALPARVSSAAAPGALEVGRSIVRTASLEVERDEPQKGPPETVALAKSHGGYAELVTDSAVTARVPAERLDAFLAAVPSLGKVSRQSVSAEDVTEAHRDLKVRLDNVARVRARYLELLERATTVSDTLSVERELERVTADYESLKARLESVEAQVSLATVRVDFERPVRPGPVGWVFYGLARGVKWLFVWD